ncbi:MAG: metallophosphoesterase [Kiritimatiellales bacterium]
MNKRIVICAALSLLVCYSMAQQPGGKKEKREKPAGKQGGGGNRGAYPPPAQVWKVATIILGCPEKDRITMSIYPADDLEGYIEYGGKQTAVQPFPAKTPTQLTLTGLSADTETTYRLRYRNLGESEFKTGPDYNFHTWRAPGKPFVFEIQGDSHPERMGKQNDPVLYEQTLLAVAKDRPDFFLCIGDDFSVDTLQDVNATTVKLAYLKQRPYFGLFAHSTPLFLVNGNHEQASRANLDGTPDNVAVWAQNSRNSLFPQPAPDGFYSGDKEEVEHIGLLRDYYAWTWGDALFVTIDPYWHSEQAVDNKFGGGKKDRDMWDITLGDAQYQWLKKTLEESTAKYKFIFTHHVNGTGRGGVKQADLYEWGGKGRGGSSEFKTKRPGWELPIHQLMAKNKVTIFFQGHDHIFAREKLDGVIYQTLPDPANTNPDSSNVAAYPGADIFPNSGRVRVSVSPEKVQVEYVASRLPQDSTAEHPDGEIIFKYDISSQ